MATQPQTPDLFETARSLGLIIGDYRPGHRVLERVTVAGDVVTR
jgi:hypothetical protein